MNRENIVRSPTAMGFLPRLATGAPAARRLEQESLIERTALERGRPVRLADRYNLQSHAGICHHIRCLKIQKGKKRLLHLFRQNAAAFRRQHT